MDAKSFPFGGEPSICFDAGFLVGMLFGQSHVFILFAYVV